MRAARADSERCIGGVRVPVPGVLLAVHVRVAIAVHPRLLLLLSLRLVPAARRGTARRGGGRRPLPQALPSRAAGAGHREVRDEARAAGRGRCVVALTALGLAAVVALLALTLAALGRRRGGGLLQRRALRQ
uniref:Uncharacterized protein n=1 Tax=Cricetulus griseus TaxID=10029 RepID=A0A8C2LL67_CRIGR